MQQRCLEVRALGRVGYANALDLQKELEMRGLIQEVQGSKLQHAARIAALLERAGIRAALLEIET